MRKGIGLVALALCCCVPRASRAQGASQGQPSGQSQSGGQAQTPKSASPSPAKVDPLVEAARKARQAKKGTPPPVVFTNENMPTSATAISVVGDAPASANSSPSSTRTIEARDTKNDEQLGRQKFAAARSKLREDTDKLDVMKRYFNETDSVMMQQAALDQEKRIAADKKAIDDLEDALRKAGGDAAWSR